MVLKTDDDSAAILEPWNQISCGLNCVLLIFGKPMAIQLPTKSEVETQTRDLAILGVLEEPHSRSFTMTTP